MSGSAQEVESTINWNFVTDIPVAYIPRAFKSRNHLLKILKSKVIVNESGRELTASEIELLALGFNFITSKEESSVSLDRKWSPDQGTDQYLLDACDSLKNQSDFYVMGSAKGGAFVSWDRQKYEKEALRVLGNEENYEIILKRHDFELADSVWDRMQVSNHVERMIENRHFLAERALFSKCIGYREATIVKKWTQSFPFVFFKPKIHKPAMESTGTFESKPTVRFDWGPTAPWDDYLTRLTRPILSLLPGSLSKASDIFDHLVGCNDQQTGRQEDIPTEEIEKPLLASDLRCGNSHDCQDGWLVFKSIYASSWKSCLPFEMCVGASAMLYGEYYGELCHQALLSNDRPPPDEALFKSLLEFIVTHSYMNFQNKLIVRQIKGAPLNSGISTYIAQSVLVMSTRVLIERPPSWLVLYRFYGRNLFFITCHHPSNSSALENELVELEERNPYKDQNFLNLIINVLTSINQATVDTDQMFQLDDVIINIIRKFKADGKGKSHSIVTMTPVMNFFFDRYTLFHRTSLHPLQDMVEVFAKAMLHLKSLCSTKNIFQPILKTWAKQFYLRDFSQHDWNQFSSKCRNILSEHKHKQQVLVSVSIPQQTHARFQISNNSTSDDYFMFTRPYNIALFGPPTSEQSMNKRMSSFGKSLLF